MRDEMWRKLAIFVDVALPKFILIYLVLVLPLSNPSEDIRPVVFFSSKQKRHLRVFNVYASFLDE